MKVHFIINSTNINEFTEVYKKYTGDVFYLTNPINSSNIQFDNCISYDNLFYHKCILLITNCILNSDEFSGNSDQGNSLVTSIINSVKLVFPKCKDVFLQLSCVNPIQLSSLTKKYGNDDSPSSGALFYNFGKTLILNKTFFDSGYSTFGNNIAHEAINSLKTDSGDRFFYLCKDGKINADYTPFNLQKTNKMPNNYIDWDKVELINYSKVNNSEDDNANYVILQRVSGLEPLKQAFDKKRDENDYSSIEYYGISLCDIFRKNSFARLNAKTQELVDATEDYPFVTFKLKKEGGYAKFTPNKENHSFKTSDDGFENLGKSSLRQFVFEGTCLFDALIEKIGNQADWIDEQVQTLEEYVNSSKFTEDIEEEYLLKILNKESKETYYSRLMTYCFAKSPIILESLINSLFSTKLTIKTITGVYNEKDYNIDIMLTFIDENENEHLIVFENKIYANITTNETKTLEQFFKKAADKETVDEVEKEYELEQQRVSLEYSQLTKYYQIAQVISKKRSIEKQNIHFVIIAPEFRNLALNSEKKKYYYGSEYSVASYKLLYNAIAANVDKIKEDEVKDIIIQMKRSIWPYISDKYTYYQRTMVNRFAREAKEQKNKNQ